MTECKEKIISVKSFEERAIEPAWMHVCLQDTKHKSLQDV